MQLSVHRVIKLLTLVQDSSMEQKPELFLCAKVQYYLDISKFKQRLLLMQLVF
jgi:hypothetical protein